MVDPQRSFETIHVLLTPETIGPWQFTPQAFRECLRRIQDELNRSYQTVGGVRMIWRVCGVLCPSPDPQTLDRTPKNLPNPLVRLAVESVCRKLAQAIAQDAEGEWPREGNFLDFSPHGPI
jgi:hypothetical protein